MKFSVSREKFIGSLGVAARGVSTRSAIQTLAGIRLDAQEASSGVELQATDMELGIRVIAEASVERPGSVVLVSASERELRMVATDSYRLSVKETSLEDALEGSLEANVPARTLQELSRISTADGGDQIEIAALEHQVIFRVGGVTLSSRLVEGRFPNYKQLLPEAFEHELHLNGPEVSDVVRRISLLAQKNAPLRMKFTEGTLEVSAQT